MRIDRLELEGFRNYVREAADFDSRCNVICGENAQGKTNLLEALVYLSRGKSPRARTDREMIGFQADSARLLARSIPGTGSLRSRRICSGGSGGSSPSTRSP